MRTLRLTAWTLLLAGCATTAGKQIEQDIQRVWDDTKPALVTLEVVKEYFSGGKKQQSNGLGSGFVIDAKKGLVVTNYHVAGDAAKIICTLSNRKKVYAEVVGEDPWTDIAVVQLDPEAIRNVELAELPFGDIDQVEEGERVCALGAPMALSKTITTGIVSCKSRVLKLDFESKADMGQSENPFTVWIQHTSPIYGGNSGGPLVNMNGEVVGVNTRGAAGGLSLAVSVDIVQEVVGRILQKRAPQWSWIGWDLSELTEDYQKFYKTGEIRGALIQNVVRDSPAAHAGFQSGDILVEFQGEPVKAEFKEEIPPVNFRVARTAVGSSVTVTVWREGKLYHRKLATESLEDSEQPPMTQFDFFQRRKDFYELEKYGLVVQRITKREAERQKVEKPYGIFVSSVSNGSRADVAGLKSGDVIKKVDDATIANLEQFRKLFPEKAEKETKPKKDRKIVFTIQRGQSSKIVVMKEK